MVHNAQKEIKQGTTVQYRPQTQIKEVYNEEAQYRTSLQVNQHNANQQNQMAPNTSTTETYNKIHPNITPHSYVQEQHKKELNQSQTGKQMHYNQPTVEKSVPTRTLSNETHHELYQAILKHLQESAKQVQPPQPQSMPEMGNPGISTKTKETRKEHAQTQTGKEEIQTENLKTTRKTKTSIRQLLLFTSIDREIPGRGMRALASLPHRDNPYANKPFRRKRYQ